MVLRHIVRVAKRAPGVWYECRHQSVGLSRLRPPGYGGQANVGIEMAIMSNLSSGFLHLGTANIINYFVPVHFEIAMSLQSREKFVDR